MKKLFELTTKDFLSGVSEVSHGLRGLFFSATGVSPLINPRRSSNDFGLLQTSAAPVDMTGAVVVDVPRVWVSEATAANTGYLYIFGNAGNFYVVDLSDNTITNERSGANKITNPANGMVIYGNTNLFYAQTTQIGMCTETGTKPFDTSSGWDNDWSGANKLNDSVYHPMYPFGGRIFVGDDNELHDISGGINPVFTQNVMTSLEADYRILCFSDDGFNLVIGVTQNLGDVSIMGRSKVCFWNTFDDYYSKEWFIPEPHISSIKKMGGWNYAITSGGIYKFSYGSPPVKVVEGVDCLYGQHAACDVLEGTQLLVGRRTNYISSYGSPLPGYPKAVFNPFTGWAAAQGVHLLATTAKRGTIYFGTNDSKLYRQDVVTGGATGLSATTNFISLREKTKIEQIKIILGTDLASGDSLRVDINSDSGDAPTVFGTASFADHGAVRRITLHSTFDVEDVQLKFNFNAGNVKIKRVEVFGTPYKQALK